MKKRTWAKLVVSLLVVGGIAVGLHLRWSTTGQGSDPLVAWGQGYPTLLERTYYISRINRVIEKWGQTGRQASYERDGRFKDSYRTYLVIDLDRQAIWIEDNGQIRKSDYAEFFPGMKWKLHHATQQDNKELSGRVVLKIRGAHAGRREPEVFNLIGTGRGTGHFNFRIHPTGADADLYQGQFQPQPYRPRSSMVVDDSYGSILVTESEYQQHQADVVSASEQAYSLIEENEANWLRAEKAIYGQIVGHLRKAGFELRSLKVKPGPDFSAGHAEVRASNNSVLHGLFGGYSSTQAYLKIDYLGDDVWYARSAPDPRQPMLTRNRPKLEFLVCATGDIPVSESGDLIAKGRSIQRPMDTLRSKWKVTLPNGAIVEFIGICESPSVGEQWWGPDGSPIDYVPYPNALPYDKPRSDRKIYEIAWRIRRPASSSGGGTKSSLEGCVGSYSRQIPDRYGNRMIGNLHAEGYAFDKSREKTALKLGVKISDQDYQYVTFNNISLVPGKNAGFEIEVQN